MKIANILQIGVLGLCLAILQAKASGAVLRRLPKEHPLQKVGREHKTLDDEEPLVSGCLTPPSHNKTVTPSSTWQTDCDYISYGSCCIYKMYLYADKAYDFSLCANDGVGASCDDDGDMEMFNSFGTTQWHIDYGSNCSSVGSNWAASTLGGLYEAWSPPSDGYYYLRVSEYDGYSMNYCLAYSQTQVQTDYDYYIQADSHPDNTIELVFAFLTNPGRVYFSRSPACGTLTPSYDDPTIGGGYYWVSTEYNPCETECGNVTITADPTFGENQTRTIHLDDRSHILCCEETWLGVTTHDADTGECGQAHVTVSVIPPEGGIVSPASGSSYWDPLYQCYVFQSTFTPNCSHEGRVRVKFHTTGNDVIYSFDMNPAITPPDSWQTVSDSFCTEGLDQNYYQAYKMYLSANKRYNFTLCEDDGVGASCDADGDLRIFDSSCTSLWHIDGASSCDYHASTIGTVYEDWSPPSNGYYYLKVSDYLHSQMSYTLAYIGDEPPNHSPILSEGHVDPNTGDPDSSFHWYVQYYDEDGDPPSLIEVYIDGERHTMSLVSGSGSPSDGTYRYGPVKLAGGSHDCYFHCEDSRGGSDRLPDSGSYPGPAVFDPTGTCWDTAECAGQPYGDATCDGQVNLADLYALKANFGRSAPWIAPDCSADFDHDGSVSESDLLILRDYFGTSGYTPSTLNQTCPP
jgi:hypothetical protein